jgi:hypothetical protein
MLSAVVQLAEQPFRRNAGAAVIEAFGTSSKRKAELNM